MRFALLHAAAFAAAVLAQEVAGLLLPGASALSPTGLIAALAVALPIGLVVAGLARWRRGDQAAALARTILIAIGASAALLNLVLRRLFLPGSRLVMVVGAVAVAALVVCVVALRVRAWRTRVSATALIALPAAIDLTANAAYSIRSGTGFALNAALSVAGLVVAGAALLFGAAVDRRVQAHRALAVGLLAVAVGAAGWTYRGWAADPGAGGSGKGQGPHVFVLSADAVRGDTPLLADPDSALAQFAAEGTAFAYAYSPSSATIGSVTGFLSGLRSAGGPPRVCGLRAGGYRTVYSMGYRQKTILPECFDVVYAGGFPRAQQGLSGLIEVVRARLRGVDPLYVPAAEQEQFLEQVLAKQDRTAPLFYFEHVLSAHFPYTGDPPLPAGTCGVAEADVNRLMDRLIYDHEALAGEPDKVAALRCFHEQETRQWDAHLERTLARIRAFDPQAIVIVTADHGEEFLEHGTRTHARNLYGTTVHVPLVIAGPKIPVGCRHPHPFPTAEAIDWALGWDQPGPTCADPRVIEPQADLVASELNGQRAWRTGDGGLILPADCSSPTCGEWLCVRGGEEISCKAEQVEPGVRSRLEALVGK